MSDEPPPLPQYPRSSGFESFPARDPRAEPPPSTTRAFWALVLCCIPGLITIVIGAVLAMTVLIDSAREKRDYGRKLAIAALGVAAFWLVVGVAVLLFVLTGRADRDESGQVVSAGRALVIDLAVGDCIETTPEEDKADVFADVVPCSDPHTGEVYATFELAQFDDVDSAAALVEEECATRFTDFFTGATSAAADLGLLYYTPTDARSFRDDPTSICIVISPEPATGSVNDAAGGNN